MTVQCPACQATFTPILAKYISFNLPPTGSDYDWVESREALNCPKCGEYLAARVRRFLDGGGAPEIQEIFFGDDPNWSAYNLAWSADGAWLAVQVKAGVRVYGRYEQRWQLIFKHDVASFCNWSDNDLVTIADEHYTCLHIPTQRVIWTRPRQLDDWYHLDTELLQGSLLALGGEKELFYQHIAVRDLVTGQSCAVNTAELRGCTAKTWFNLAKCQVLCGRFESFRQHNTLELWQFDLTAGSFDKIASYTVPVTTFPWATWDSAGDILVVELHNHKGLVFYDNMPYGLVRLDGQTLAVKEQITQIPLQACPSQIELRQAHEYDSGQLVWCTDKIHLLEETTWAYQGSWPYLFSGYTRVAIAGLFAAVSAPNDVHVIDLLTAKVWSLRRERLI